MSVAAAYKLQCDQVPIAWVSELFSSEMATVALKKFRENRCTSFDDATTMTPACFDAITSEASDSFKEHIDMQDMCTDQNVRGRESKVDRFMVPHKTLPSLKRGSFQCNLRSGLVSYCKSLPRKF